MNLDKIWAPPGHRLLTIAEYQLVLKLDSFHGTRNQDICLFSTMCTMLYIVFSGQRMHFCALAFGLILVQLFVQSEFSLTGCVEIQPNKQIQWCCLVSSWERVSKSQPLVPISIGTLGSSRSMRWKITSYPANVKRSFYSYVSTIVLCNKFMFLQVWKHLL